MAEPNSLQHLAIHSLKNGVPAGSKLLNFAYGAQGGAADGDVPFTVSRTYERNGSMAVEQFTVTIDGKAQRQ